MGTTPRILAFAGSLRRDSFNKKLVQIAAAGATAAGAEVTYLDIADYPLPVYNGDLEAADGLPENAVALKQIFLDHDGLLISCPEYNSSISAALKNLIDWVSRPHGDEKPLACFDGKVAALLAASPGGLGGLRGLVTVRSILNSIKVIMLPDQFALGGAHDAFNDDGGLKDDKQRERAEAIGARLAQVLKKLTT